MYSKKGKLFYNLHESAKYLGVDIETVREYVRKEELPTIEFRGRLYIKEDILEAFKLRQGEYE